MEYRTPRYPRHFSRFAELTLLVQLMRQASIDKVPHVFARVLLRQKMAARPDGANRIKG